MWNGDLGLADDLIADGLVVHLTRGALGDPAALRDARAVAPWVARIRGQYARLTYTTAAGPFVDIDARVVSASWFADGIDSAGQPFRKARARPPPLRRARQDHRVLDDRNIDVPLPA